VIENTRHGKFYDSGYREISGDIPPHRSFIDANHLGYLALRQARIIYQFFKLGAHHE